MSWRNLDLIGIATLLCVVALAFYAAVMCPYPFLKVIVGILGCIGLLMVIGMVKDVMNGN